MASDYSKIRRAIQEAKHLTDAERDSLVNMLWTTEDDDRFLMDVQVSESSTGGPYLRAVYGENNKIYSHAEWANLMNRL